MSDGFRALRGREKYNLPHVSISPQVSPSFYLVWRIEEARRRGRGGFRAGSDKIFTLSEVEREKGGAFSRFGQVRGFSFTAHRLTLQRVSGFWISFLKIIKRLIE